jgi:Domain of unknown function (DUF4268)
MLFGNLTIMEIREIWAREATDFTPWLADNIQLLGKEIGLELELIEREASVGSFSCDIHAIDLTNNREVVIENQLEPTDHGHLGQLLTYAAGIEACVVIWIAKEIKDEHRAALDWLNRKTPPGIDFFAVEPQVFRIDESNPVVKFNLVVVPNEWKKDVSTPRNVDPDSRASAYKNFFQDVIDDARKNNFKGTKRAPLQSWIRFSTSKPCFGLYVAFKKNNRISVELFIESIHQVINKQIYDKLFESKDQINNVTNNELTWERLDERKGSRICFYLEGSIEDQPEYLDSLKNLIIEKLIIMREVVLDHAYGAVEKFKLT